MAPRNSNPDTTNMPAPNTRNGWGVEGANESSDAISACAEDERDDEGWVSATVRDVTSDTELDAELEMALREVAPLDAEEAAYAILGDAVALDVAALEATLDTWLDASCEEVVDGRLEADEDVAKEEDDVAM
jgi:hypothetical protein